MNQFNLNYLFNFVNVITLYIITINNGLLPLIYKIISTRHCLYSFMVLSESILITETLQTYPYQHLIFSSRTKKTPYYQKYLIVLNFSGLIIYLLFWNDLCPLSTVNVYNEGLYSKWIYSSHRYIRAFIWRCNLIIEVLYE